MGKNAFIHSCKAESGDSEITYDQILKAEETLSQDNANGNTLLSLINQRISRAWEKDPSNVAAIVAFLRANGTDQDSKFCGKYSIKISIVEGK